MHAVMDKLSRCQPLLGTYVEIEIEAKPELELTFETLVELSNSGFEMIREVQNALSFHDPHSELTQVNSSAHKAPLIMSQHLATVMHFALELAEATDGIFDPTIAPHLIRQELLPEHSDSDTASAARSTWQDIILNGRQIYFKRPVLIDLGGIAKGYAVDQALAAILKKNPRANVRINAGGDTIDTQWKNRSIIIRNPKTSRPQHKTSMRRPALATTSSYYLDSGKHAIINPQTQQPSHLPQSISVFANDCMTADALTKVAVLQPTSQTLSLYGAEPITIY